MVERKQDTACLWERPRYVWSKPRDGCRWVAARLNERKYYHIGTWGIVLSLPRFVLTLVLATPPLELPPLERVQHRLEPF